MEEFGKLEERVVLVGVQTDDHDNVEESLWAADRNHLFFHPGFFHHSCNLLPSVPVLLFIGALPEINNNL